MYLRASSIIRNGIQGRQLRRESLEMELRAMAAVYEQL